MSDHLSLNNLKKQHLDELANIWRTDTKNTQDLQIKKLQRAIGKELFQYTVTVDDLEKKSPPQLFPVKRIKETAKILGCSLQPHIQPGVLQIVWDCLYPEGPRKVKEERMRRFMDEMSQGLSQASLEVLEKIQKIVLPSYSCPTYVNQVASHRPSDSDLSQSPGVEEKRISEILKDTLALRLVTVEQLKEGAQYLGETVSPDVLWLPLQAKTQYKMEARNPYGAWNERYGQTYRPSSHTEYCLS